MTLFESVGGSYSAANISAPNTFYLHFDSDGQLVGTTTGLASSGDKYQATGATVATAGTAVSGRLGETMSYSPANSGGTIDDPPGTQTYISTMSITIASTFDSGGDTVTIVSSEPALTLSGADEDAAALNLVQDINQRGSGYWAEIDAVNSNQVNVYSDGSAPLTVPPTTAPTSPSPAPPSTTC